MASDLSLVGFLGILAIVFVVLLGMLVAGLGQLLAGVPNDRTTVVLVVDGGDEAGGGGDGGGRGEWYSFPAGAAGGGE